MDVVQLRKTVDRAVDGIQEERTYLGMSQIGQCAFKLYRDMVNGRRRPHQRLLRLYHEGYLHQEDVLERLRREGVVVKHVEREVVADFDRRFIGHIDGEIDGDLLEIKSVRRPGFDSVRRRGAMPRHREQMQAYMRHGNYRRALIVYKCREDGDVWVAEVVRSHVIGEELDEKAREILAAVDGQADPPACTCDRCR